jgi:hypothetical protein
MATGIWCSFCAGGDLERPCNRQKYGSGLAPASSVHEILRQTGIHPGHMGVYLDLFWAVSRRSMAERGAFAVCRPIQRQKRGEGWSTRRKDELARSVLGFNSRDLKTLTNDPSALYIAHAHSDLL